MNLSEPTSQQPAPGGTGKEEQALWQHTQHFFQAHPLEGVKANLWEFYKGWTYSTRELAGQEKAADMLCFYETLGRFFDTCYRNGEQEAARTRCRAHAANVANVQEIVAFLAETVQPEKIFLLNNPLPDVAGETGYIDLLVVLPYRNHILFEEHEALIEFANLRNRYVTCSLHRLDAVKEALKKGHIFYSLSCIPENLVYDKSIHELPVTPKELFPEIKEKARKEFDENYSRALEFYEGALIYATRENNVLSPFMLQQATELTYRAIILSLVGKEKRTHSLKTLIKHSRRCAPQLNSVFPRDTPEEKQLVHLLDEAYLKARYENDYVMEDATLAVLFERVKQLQVMAKQVFEEKLRVFE